MKRVCVLLCAVLFCLLGGLASASAATLNDDAARTLEIRGGEFVTNDTTAAFWEYPKLTAGQTRRGGTLTFVNRDLVTAAVTLSDMELPYDNEAAMTYLNALRLTLCDGDTVLYDGAYLRLLETGLSAPLMVKSGESREVTVTVSCDFAYAGEANPGQIIYWGWARSMDANAVLRMVLDGWMLWVPVLVLLIVLMVVAKSRRKARKKTASAAPTTPAKQPTPQTPSRQPVTLRIEPEATKPASKKARHAAPRHAKK